jgi:hypothetical protein
MGVISTPKAGGTVPRMPRRRGSVGQTTRLYGNSLRFDFGYHEITTRQSYKTNEFKVTRYGMNGCPHNDERCVSNLKNMVMGVSTEKI